MVLTTARIELGLSLTELYALTPRLFAAYLKRHRDRITRDREHAEFLFGQLTSWVANTGFRTAEKPTKPSDFMPSQWAKPEPGSKPSTSKPKRRRMTKQRRADVLKSLQLIFPR